MPFFDPRIKPLPVSLFCISHGVLPVVHQAWLGANAGYEFAKMWFGNAAARDIMLGLKSHGSLTSCSLADPLDDFERGVL
jgi:hypothetical protein